MDLKNEIEAELIQQGADFVRFADVSQLHYEQNKGYPNAILIGMALSPDFIQQISKTPDCVNELVLNNPNQKDDFHLKEAKTDELADLLAAQLSSKGYWAYSQSERNILASGCYDPETKSTPLPHKTIAGLAGLGWIGKHNLLVTPDYGSAISLCSILTDAPIQTSWVTPSDSRCGSCSVCKEICEVNAIKGRAWSIGISRDEIVDVMKCTTCLKCLALCPWSQGYMKRKLVLQAI